MDTKGGTPQDLAQRLGKEVVSLTREIGPCWLTERGIEEMPTWQIRLDQLKSAGVPVDNRPLILARPRPGQAP